MKTVAFHNLGCKTNAYEVDIMQQKFTENGFQVVPFSQKADIYVVNTCSVTNIADRKSRQMLHKARKMNPDAIVVATGCYAQTDTEGAKADDAIDIIIGNNHKNELVDIVNAYIADNSINESVDDLTTPIEYEDYKIAGSNERTRVDIKIQDGCNQFCSYCAIPLARGRVRSRSIDDTVNEIEGLTKAGYKEFVLTGIHLSSYKTEDGKELIDAIEAVSKIEAVGGKAEVI